MRLEIVAYDGVDEIDVLGPLDVLHGDGGAGTADGSHRAPSVESNDESGQPIR
jgi:putative intracellular protease/amidase